MVLLSCRAVAAATGTTEDDLIARAAAVESNSEHPLARAIVAEAKRRSASSCQPQISRRCPAEERRQSWKARVSKSADRAC